MAGSPMMWAVPGVALQCNADRCAVFAVMWFQKARKPERSLADMRKDDKELKKMQNTYSTSKLYRTDPTLKSRTAQTRATRRPLA